MRHTKIISHEEKIFIAFCSLLPALHVFGWGQKGHDVTAYIAECHLTPAAADSVSAILDGRSLVYWAKLAR